MGRHHKTVLTHSW